MTIEALPMPLRWRSQPAAWSSGGGELSITAAPRTDLFADPQGATPVLNAPCLLGVAPEGDFMLSARVAAGLEATYDAGALVLYAHEGAWAKLCLERSPQGQPMVVSVVTRGVSDDCNSFVAARPRLWLRVARLGPALAFHASDDGGSPRGSPPGAWQLVRHFALGAGEPLAVGFGAQSPTGEGCTATFAALRYTPERLRDLRSGD